MKKKIGAAAVMCIMLLGTSTLAGIHSPLLETSEETTETYTQISLELPPPKITADHEYAVIDSGNEMTCLMNEGFPLLPYKS